MNAWTNSLLVQKNKTVAYLVYRPAGIIINNFFVRFESLLTESQMCSGKKIYLRDFNVLIDQQKSVDANKFRSVLNNNNIVSVSVEPPNTISDHMVVNFNIFVDSIAKKKKTEQ